MEFTLENSLNNLLIDELARRHAKGLQKMRETLEISKKDVKKYIYKGQFPEVMEYMYKLKKYDNHSDSEVEYSDSESEEEYSDSESSESEEEEEYSDSESECSSDESDSETSESESSYY